MARRGGGAARAGPRGRARLAEAESDLEGSWEMGGLKMIGGELRMKRKGDGCEEQV